jgi:VanZ family protein
MNSRPYLFRALTVGWMLLIFLLSSQSSLPTIRLFSGTDLLAHAVFYGVLCVLLARSLRPPRVTTWKRVLLLTTLVTAYGITDEYHQLFVPGRNASGWDILADGLGGFLAALMLFWWDRRTMKTLQHVHPDEKGTLRAPWFTPSQGAEKRGKYRWIT